MFKKWREKWRNRPRRTQRISYGRKVRYNWDTIKRLNNGLGITRDSCYVDNNGYLRWKANTRLCHREIAHYHIYKKGSFPNKFSEYDIHHRDQNKFNNNPANLKILQREDHELEHGKIIYELGQKYIRLVPANRRRAQTHKAILIGGKRGEWYPKTQLIWRYG